jgi:purine-nucleoside phosphorylase
MRSRAGWRRGVLAYSAGPCYETPAEARLLRAAGADVVSMSAALEASALAGMGLRVACLCTVTNMVGPPASHGEVLQAAGGSRKKLSLVLDNFLSIAAGQRWGE